MANPEFMVYNTMNRKKESFRPKVQGKVDMYVCGVTAYDLSHLGHARAAVSFDYLYRYLQYSGFEVTYVRNFTDVDDKIIRRANEGGEDPLALSSRYCQKYLEDMADLNCLLPTQQPRVSDHMDDIIAMITQIIKNGRAYEVEGDVYFAVDTFPDYGKLSGRKLEDNRAGERVAIDSRKKNPADFALWKRAKPDEPSWESPWGPGRPGWHIECSAMSAHFLTSTFDIHGGGIDLIFPHHENEIAQSCAACQESKVSYWMHNGHVTNNNEKMSKSVGNFFTIREITEQYHPLALRYFLSTTHYRSQINYSISQLEFASEAVFYIYQTLQDCEDAILSLEENIPKGAGGNKKPVRITPAAQECISKLRSEFKSKMDDDLMTPPILNAVLLEPLKFINSSLKTLKKKKQKQQEVESLKEIVKEVKLLMNVLGLLAVKEVKQDIDSGLVSALKFSEVLQQLKDKALKRAQMTEADVLGLIEERDAARKNKEFAKGDQIRSDLTLKGISLMDEGKETTWRPCVPTEHQQSAATA